MPDLTGAQIYELQQALLSAYPELSSLRQLTTMGLNQNLAAIVTETDLSSTIFDLIKWAQAHGLLQELIQKAHRHNPGNSELRRLAVPTNIHAIKRYLRQVIDATAEYIAKRRPVELDAEETDAALQPLLDWNDRDFSPVALATGASHPSQAATYHSFAEAFVASERRMILLGQPGAGKSTTLQSFANKAATDRLNDPSLPIPAVIFLHRIKDVRFSTLPPGELPTLLQRTAANSTDILAGQPLVYILDGLDEMGGERPVDPANPDGEKCDARAEFLACLQQQLHNDRVVISCRVIDYNQIQAKVLLSGAVTLLPLSDDKIREFVVDKLDQPNLLSLLEKDASLRDLARTPLLLALLSIAAGDSRNAIQLHSASELLTLYVQKRYEHEADKGTLPYTLEQVRRMLGSLAEEMYKPQWEAKLSLTVEEAKRHIGDETEIFLDMAQTLQLLMRSLDGTQIEFPHLAFRDHFAIPELIKALGDTEFRVRYSAVISLCSIGTAVVPELIKALGHTEDQVRRSATEALSNFGRSAIPQLERVLTDRNAHVRDGAKCALNRINELIKQYDVWNGY